MKQRQIHLNFNSRFLLKGTLLRAISLVLVYFEEWFVTFSLLWKSISLGTEGILIRKMSLEAAVFDVAWWDCSQNT